MKSMPLFYIRKTEYFGRTGALLFGMMGLLLLTSHAGLAAPRVTQASAWSLTVFAANKTNDALGDTVLFNADFPQKQHFVSVAIAKKLDSYRQVDFELEGQVAKHYAAEKYKEYTVAVLARWAKLSWDDVVNMRFAVGEGLSYTTVISQLEAEGHEDTNRLLNFLIFETSFAIPENNDWEVVLRIHHRSGVFGLFNGVHGASNAWALGLRYHF